MHWKSEAEDLRILFCEDCCRKGCIHTGLGNDNEDINCSALEIRQQRGYGYSRIKWEQPCLR